MLVIDEADEMLSKGFKEQLYDIYRFLPPQTQVVLVSATMPHDVLEMTTKFMVSNMGCMHQRITSPVEHASLAMLRIRVQCHDMP